MCSSYSFPAAPLERAGVGLSISRYLHDVFGAWSYGLPRVPLAKRPPFDTETNSVARGFRTAGYQYLLVGADSKCSETDVFCNCCPVCYSGLQSVAKVWQFLH